MKLNEYQEIQDRFLDARYDDIKKYLKAEKDKFCKNEQAERWKRFDFMKTVVWPILFCLGMYVFAAHYASLDYAITIYLALAGGVIAIWIEGIVKNEHRRAAEEVFCYHEKPKLLRQYFIEHKEDIMADATNQEEREKLQEFIYLSLLYIYDPNSGWDIAVH